MLAGGGDEAAGGVVARAATNSVTMGEGGMDEVSEPGKGAGLAVSTDPSPGPAFSRKQPPTRRALAPRRCKPLDLKSELGLA